MTAVNEEKNDSDKTQEPFRKFETREVIFVIAALVLVTITVTTAVVLVPNETQTDSDVPQKCYDTCKLTLVETIPENLTYPAGSPVHMDTYESWSTLIDVAARGIDIGQYYWTMRQEDVVNDTSAWKGEEIFQRLLDTGKAGDISLRIAQNANTNPTWLLDTEILEEEGAAEVRTLNFTRFQGSGILHTKMWVVDEAHFYVGSANMDWRALTQVKEMGIMASDCACMGRDLQKVFTVYWMMGEEASEIPSTWPPELATNINMDNPMSLEIGGLNETVFISVAPPSFLPEGRSSDITALLNIIDTAQEFIYIALMDYFPTTLYQPSNIYWPDIDDRLRAAAFERGVKVKLMPSWWRYSNEHMKPYLRSLQAMSPAVDNLIEVKLFEVPIVTPEQEKIPYSRVNHNKYMVTETTAFIGTSNWSGDYFRDTAGVSVIVSQTKGSTPTEENIHVQLKAVFDRDWESPYTKSIDEAGV